MYPLVVALTCTILHMLDKPFYKNQNKEIKCLRKRSLFGRDYALLYAGTGFKLIGHNSLLIHF